MNPDPSDPDTDPDFDPLAEPGEGAPDSPPEGEGAVRRPISDFASELDALDPELEGSAPPLAPDPMLDKRARDDLLFGKPVVMDQARDEGEDDLQSLNPPTRAMPESPPRPAAPQQKATPPESPAPTEDSAPQKSLPLIGEDWDAEDRVEQAPAPKTGIHDDSTGPLPPIGEDWAAEDRAEQAPAPKTGIHDDSTAPLPPIGADWAARVKAGGPGPVPPDASQQTTAPKQAPGPPSTGVGRRARRQGAKTPPQPEAGVGPVSTRREILLLGLILLAALVHGLLYATRVPAWQHYDEPTHFEHAWLIADRRALPETDGFDLDMRSELVRSMIANDFYRGLPNPNPNNLPPRVAGLLYPQLDEPPLYYLLAAVPVSLLSEKSLSTQLLGARLVSLGLYLVTILAAYGTVRALTQPGSPWRLLVPATIALVPGFADLMTAVNNDVGAVAIFSLFLWGAVRLLRQFSILDLLWVLVTAWLAFHTKSTAFLAIPLALVAIALAVVPRRFRRWAWLGVGVAALLGVLLVLTWTDAAHWYRATTQSAPTRVLAPETPLGQYALQFNPRAETTPRWLRPLHQPLPPETARSLAGKEITLGVWIWAFRTIPASQDAQNEALTINAPILSTEGTQFSTSVEVSDQPQFYAFTYSIPENTSRIWLSLAGERGEGALTLYYDGFVLTEGAYPLDQVPAFESSAGESGEWGGQPFLNLLGNPSVEEAWPAVRPAVDTMIARLLPDNARLSMLLYTVLDWDAAGWYYRITANNLFRTFWATFGWGQVPLQNGEFLYPVLWVLTVLGGLGAGVYFLRRQENLPWDALLFLGAALLVVWGGALVRGAIFIFVDRVFIPGARYAYPVIAPSLLLLVVGWFSLFGILTRWLRIPSQVFIVVYLLGFLALDAISLLGIQNYYS